MVSSYIESDFSKEKFDIGQTVVTRNVIWGHLYSVCPRRKGKVMTGPKI